MLTLGADAVFLGRAWVNALAAAGEDGVVNLITNMERELRVAMAMTGNRTLQEIRDESGRRATARPAQNSDTQSYELRANPPSRNLAGCRHQIIRVRHEVKRRTLTVVSVDRLTPLMQRIEFTSADLADFVSQAADDHVKLLFPTVDHRGAANIGDAGLHATQFCR